VLDSSLDLAANPSASPEVRAAAWGELSRLRRRVAGQAAPGDEEQFRALAKRDLDEFFEKPETRKNRLPGPKVPPGRPIGSSPR
jgi:hypothetical protein